MDKKPGSAARTASITHTRRQFIGGAALLVGGLIVRPNGVLAQPEEGISRSAESIHQEPTFTASRNRVYEALTDTRQFDKATQLTGVMQSAPMAKMKKPTEISPHVGGEFVLFGGYITGRHIELVPNELIVQAWRTAAWSRGTYSIVRFELIEQGAGSKIVFDHTGFPNGEAGHLAAGWQANYWKPIEKLLA
jgi:activator of HSP90 ATPase